MRVTNDIWSIIHEHHTCRSATERLEHKRNFRSCYFPSEGFSKFEIQLLEMWMFTLYECIPAWLRGKIQQELRSLLESEDNTIGGNPDDTMSDFGSVCTFGDGNTPFMSQQSAVFVKMNSNLYSFDALMFLIITRVYSGHGTEREKEWRRRQPSSPSSTSRW